MKSIPLLIIAMVSIQFGASLAKSLFPVLGPFGISSLRVTLAALILWAVFRPWKTPLSRPQLKQLAIYGACLGLMNLTFYAALARIPLGIAVALEFTGPLAVAIYASRNKKDYVWALLAAIGIFLLVPPSGTIASIDIAGGLLALMAGAFWAGYILFGKSAGEKLPGGLAACWGMTFAALSILPFGIALSGAKIFQPNFILFGFAIAILSSALPYSLEMIAMKNMPTKSFGIMMSLEPAIAALAGLIILKEALTPLQWTAIALVMTASGGSALTSPQKPQEPPEPNNDSKKPTLPAVNPAIN